MLQNLEFSSIAKYPGEQLNFIFANYHEDTTALRRCVIEYGILERDGGSAYWVIEKVKEDDILCQKGHS